MDEHFPFLKAIAANPADDLPRLVYADFLEESGEPDAIARAHFIRAQIALTQLPPGGAEYRETVALQNRLFAMYSEDWIWDLPDALHADGPPEWRRGFIEFARMPWHEFLAGRPLFETVPITRVQIPSARYDHGTSAAELDSRPYVSHVTHLRLGPQLNPAALDGFDGGDAGDSGLIFLLLHARNFAGLTHLDLSANNINSGTLAEFVLRYEEAAFAPTLHSLDLSELFGLDDAVGSALATARGLDPIRRINLARTELSEPVRAMLRRRFGDRVAF